MPRTTHTARRGGIIHWRRRLPGTDGKLNGRSLSLSLGTAEPRKARARAAILDAVFEDLMTLTHARDISPEHFARAVRIARDLVAAELSERAYRLGPVARRTRPGGVVAELPDKKRAGLSQLVQAVDAMPELGPDEDIGKLPADVMKIVNNVSSFLAKNPVTPPSDHPKTGGIESEVLAIHGIAKLHRLAQSTRDHRIVDRLVDEVLRALGLEAAGGARHRIGEAVLRGANEAYDDVMDQTRGTPRSLAELEKDLLRGRRLTAPQGKSSDPTAGSPVPAALLAPAAGDVTASSSPLFSEAYESFCAEKVRLKEWGASSEKHGRLAGRLFAEAFEGIRLGEIRSATAREFSKLLEGLPNDWKDKEFYWRDRKTRALRPIREVIEATKARTDPWEPVSAVTRRRHLNFLDGFWKEMIKGFDDDPEPWQREVKTRRPPFKDLIPSKAAIRAERLPEETREAFSISQVQKLLRGEEVLDQKPRPGYRPPLPHRYFAPLIGA